MALSAKIKEFLDSPQATEIREELTRMMQDPVYNTEPKYSAIAKGSVPFVDKHINYLSVHRNINPNQYLSNLRLITRYN